VLDKTEILKSQAKQIKSHGESIERKYYKTSSNGFM
jgi:hypothetical protein